MTSERLLAAQAEIQAAPAALWERWTIDETEEEFARLLISRAANTDQLREIAGLVTEEGSPQTGKPELGGLLRSQAMHAELNPATAQWSEECFGHVRLSLLRSFLRGRAGKPGLPRNRPLREGDVFWVMVADWPGPPEPLGDFSAAELEVHVAALRTAEADVWDVTAAARQAAKRSYHEVLRRANEDDQIHAEAEHG